MKEALLFTPVGEGKAVQCGLCAHRCRILPGKRGVCRVRENRDGILYSLVYGRVAAENIDPIEKKPLYHFLPGSLSYSIGTAGCNMACSHCQNYEISIEAARRDPMPGRERSPANLVRNALDSGCLSLSYTYNEPTVFMEFARDCGLMAREKGLKNVFVTNGFMTPEAVNLLSPWLDAANVDLKGATEEHYRSICGSSLQPVLETIKALHSAGVWIEITTLAIPGLNDDQSSLETIAGFIARLDPLIPWHVSRFFPVYHMTDRPPTPMRSLERALAAGRGAGLRFIYLGNVGNSPYTTPCHACGIPLVVRAGYSLLENRLTDEGKCPGCGTPFNGRAGIV